MKAIKFTAVLTAMVLFIGATGCSAGSGGKDKAGGIEDAFDTYISKVLKGKKVAKYVENGSERGLAVTGEQEDVLAAVLSKASYKVKSSDSNKKKGEGSVTFDFKYPDVEMFAEDYDFEDPDEIDDLIDDILDAEKDEYKTEKITMEFVLEDGEWLVTEYSEADFKDYLSGLVNCVGSPGGTIITQPSGSGTDATTPTSTTGGGNDVVDLKIVPSEVSQVVYTTYNDPSGYFSMQIPTGWKVVVGLKPTLEYDLISYAICMYDPNSPDRMLYFNLNNAGELKSWDAHDWYATYYGDDNPFASMPVATEVSTKGYFEGACGYYDYTEFNMVEYVGQTPLGGDVLYATVASSLTGKTAEGLFSAMVTDFTYNVQRDMFDYSSGMVDCGFLIPYDVVIETAPEGEFIDWQPVLDYCLGSIQFTSAFMTQRQQAWGNVMTTSEYIMNNANEISDMIMDSWEQSSRTYDVISQKTSDATLGYERVYDTETNEYYRAEVGFGDWYSGNRYQVVDTDTAYLSPVSGTINWK